MDFFRVDKTGRRCTSGDWRISVGVEEHVVPLGYYEVIGE